MLRSLALIAAFGLLPVGALAQQSGPPASDATPPADLRQAESGQPPKRIRSVTLRGSERCPTSQHPDEEIVVCATEGNPYRIPKALRDDHPVTAQNQSWVNRTALADEVGREAGGLPDTCSPTGTGGQSGCAKKRAEAWAAEKRASPRELQTP